MVATGLVMTLDGVTLRNSDGSMGDTAPFSDGPGLLALLSHLFGTTPIPAPGTTDYDWGGLDLKLFDDTTAGLVVTASEVASITVQTSEGIEVGSTQGQVKAAASSGTEFATPGTSLAYYGLQARPHPGTESLAHPGQVGSDYINVDLANNVVDSLYAPGGDWQDL